jgi:hypothetical protein
MRDVAVGPFGEREIATRIVHVALVQHGPGRMRQDLVDRAAGHDVAAQEQGQGRGGTGHSWTTCA